MEKQLENLAVVVLNVQEMKEVEGGVSKTTYLVGLGCYLVCGPVGLGAFMLGYHLNS
ncbi:MULTISPECIES: hypothetical protein [Flavobacterium]|uniref:hypothetical protein n=1 Tax=Flavobacterium TaxID=237 RepID=UPI000ACA1905|nr:MULTISPECIES: hypothetical protein [Flavobacterium]MDL2141912.1 hypothetical protein [Flavobacterium tructae]URC14983.1 hypothetical protein M4I44_11525 [Flavobacterium sp. B183]